MLRTKLRISLAVLLLLLVAGELGLRLWLDRTSDIEAFWHYASHEQYEARHSGDIPRHSPHWYIGYVGTPGFHEVDPRRGEDRHNAHGLRGEEIEAPKPDGRYRIACLGGSTTYTTGVSNYRFSYPYLMERDLRAQGYDVDVLNAGLAGWTTYESLINFELNLIDLELDMIIVYHAMNDLHARIVWPASAYRGDGSGRRNPTKATIFAPPFWEHSTLVRAGLIQLGLTTPHNEQVRQLRRRTPTYLADEFFQQWQTGSYPSGPFADVSVEQIWEHNPPIYFERNLSSLIAIAQARGIDVVLTSFAYSPHFEDTAWSAGPMYPAAYAEMNAVTRRVAQTHDADFFDFAATFPQEAELWTDGTHVNRRGAKLKAKLFADFLIESDRLAAAKR